MNASGPSLCLVSANQVVKLDFAFFSLSSFYYSCQDEGRGPLPKEVYERLRPGVARGLDKHRRLRPQRRAVDKGHLFHAAHAPELPWRGRERFFFGRLTSQGHSTGKSTSAPLR